MQESYTVVREIGKGAYGTAYIVQHKVTGARFVLKKVRLARQTLKERQGSLRELQLLCSLHHRNVLSCKEAWVEAGCVVCMLTELCESGDLATQLRIRIPNSSFFPEIHLHEMLVQLASGLAFIHKNSIAHRDVKSSNILITAEGRLLLADFGLATILDADVTVSKTLVRGLYLESEVGTPGYMAPQLLGERVEYDGYKNDIWGLGCVLYEASALKPAFTAFNMAGLVKKVVTGSAPPLPSHYSDEWRSTIKAMLGKEEAQRPTAEELLALPWLKEAHERVLQRFGAELPPGAAEYVLLQELPEGIRKLADQFKQQQAEADKKQRVDNERRKMLQAKYAPRGLLQQQAQQELAALELSDTPEGKRGLAANTGAGAARQRAGAQTAAGRRPGNAQGAGRGGAAAYRRSDAGEAGPPGGGDGPRSPQRPGSAPPSPTRLKGWDEPEWESQPTTSADGLARAPALACTSSQPSTSQPASTAIFRQSSSKQLPATGAQKTAAHNVGSLGKTTGCVSVRKSTSMTPRASTDWARGALHGQQQQPAGTNVDSTAAGKQHGVRLPISSSFGAKPSTQGSGVTPRVALASKAAQVRPPAAAATGQAATAAVTQAGSGLPARGLSRAASRK